MKRISIGSWAYTIGPYAKNPVPWEEVINIRWQKSVLFIDVRNPEKYLKQLNLISEMLIKGNIKRLGTIFLIRTAQLNVDTESLKTDLRAAFEKYGSISQEEDEDWE